MEQLKVIKTLSELPEVEKYIEDNEYIAFDTETTGLDKESKIIGFSVSAHVDIGYYVVLSYWDVATQQLIDLETKTDAKRLLQLLSAKSLIMHNGTFDCYMVENNYKVRLIDSLHTDTMILGHLLDENRANGLKDLAVSIFGEDAKDEQTAMKASVLANGGELTKANYELYKADADLIGKYGAKDTILTIKLFYHLVPQLIEQGLYDFFYNDESMPLLRGPTYDLNTTGLKVAQDRLMQIKGELEAECLEAKDIIHKEIAPMVKAKYPGTKKTNNFNIGSSKQLAWLLFGHLNQDYVGLTKEGRNLCKSLGYKLPYSAKARRELIQIIIASKGHTYDEARINPKTKKLGRPKKVREVWNYIACDKAVLKKYAEKYLWVKKLLEYSKSLKLLNTYVEGIQERMQYGVIRPSFLQHGTTSGRYSSKNPNFQNLPRDDKRVKSAIVARPGKVFVGADYSQLEPRVFASFSGDNRLLDCFKSDADFYSTIGIEVFGIYDSKPTKDDFGTKHKKLRDIAKVVALSATYGTTAFKMAGAIGKSTEESQEVIDDYFEKFPKVKTFMLQSHEQAKKEGRVVNLFGRPRRMPKAKALDAIYGNTPHADLPYEARNILNLSVNHRIQSTGASIMNRAAIACHNMCTELAKTDTLWSEVKIVLQVHDELILEGPDALADDMVIILKEAMEHTVTLPGVELIAEPKIAKNLADLK